MLDLFLSYNIYDLKIVTTDVPNNKILNVNSKSVLFDEFGIKV